MASNEGEYCIIDMSSDLIKQGAVDRKPFFLFGFAKNTLVYPLYIYSI